MRSIAILGSGPAALMTAEVVSAAGHSVSIYEKRKAPGRKLLIAGSSGLNISNSLPLEDFVSHYFGGPPGYWKRLLQDFSPKDWIKFIEGELGLETFEGTSGRYFVREMKAANLLRVWVDRLKQKGVQFFFEHEVVSFDSIPGFQMIRLGFANGKVIEADAVCFCLGGGSYEPQETPLRWPAVFTRHDIGFQPFVSSNAGFQVEWSEAFLKECDGLPLKNIRLVSSRGNRKGDLVITQYGLEGTPVYAVGESGVVKIDLKPDLTVEQILTKCRTVKENLSPLRRVKKMLALCSGSQGLIFHFAPKPVLSDLEKLAHYIKAFPIEFKNRQSLPEAISSSGGLEMKEFNDTLMLKTVPGVFAAGEMLDWDAPTGGFLIQGCISQGVQAGMGILGYLNR